MILDTFLLNTQQYKIRKWSHQGKGECPSLHIGAVTIEKGTFGLPSTTVANLIIIAIKTNNSNQRQLVACLAVLFYSLSTLFRSFNSELSHIDKSLK